MGWFWSDSQSSSAAQQQQQQQQQQKQMPAGHPSTGGDISKCPVMHNADSAASPLNNPDSPFYAGPRSQSQSQPQSKSAWSKVMEYANASNTAEASTGTSISAERERRGGGGGGGDDAGSGSGSGIEKCPVTHDKDSPSSPLNNPNSPFYISPGGEPKRTIATHPDQLHQLPTSSSDGDIRNKKNNNSSNTSWTSKLNPLNYMPNISNTKTSPNQTVELNTKRTSSSIPRSSSGEVWDYPSPQQMYNAVIRKGHTDTDPTGIPAMVAVHNWLNEGTWAEVERWDSVFRGRTLWQAWQLCARGRENVDEVLERQEEERERLMLLQQQQTDQAAAFAVTVPNGPTLERFQGRPGDLTPRARVLGLLGKMFPDKFSDTPPFDRHDWYVRRETLRGPMTMRYVIDFYSLPPEPDGMPAFNVDVRPALDSPRAAMERFIVWAGDLWWRASGGVAREAERRKKELEQARGVRG